jgi:hypothetical protein
VSQRPSRLNGLARDPGMHQAWWSQGFNLDPLREMQYECLGWHGAKWTAHILKGLASAAPDGRSRRRRALAAAGSQESDQASATAPGSSLVPADPADRSRSDGPCPDT